MSNGLNIQDSSWHQAVTQLESNHLPYVLITLLGGQGSVPRDSGTKMVVANGDQNNQQHQLKDQKLAWGTIGGGHLEYKVMNLAAEMLQTANKTGRAEQRLEHLPLGASLGQCCGGRTSVLLECFPGADLTIALFGAGHVGRALASILSQLPCRVYWIDSREEEFPEQIPMNTVKCVSDLPVDEVANMPDNTYYLVMTHQHSLDFDITSQALKRADTRADVRYVGLIGSQTKWRRFQMRFAHRDIAEELYQSVHCPIGLSEVPGKRPMEVAVSIAAELIAEYQSDKTALPKRQGIAWSELKQLAMTGQELVDQQTADDQMTAEETRAEQTEALRP